jgi:hypothetical protein
VLAGKEIFVRVGPTGVPAVDAAQSTGQWLALTVTPRLAVREAATILARRRLTSRRWLSIRPVLDGEVNPADATASPPL